VATVQLVGKARFYPSSDDNPDPSEIRYTRIGGGSVSLTVRMHANCREVSSRGREFMHLRQRDPRCGPKDFLDRIAPLFSGGHLSRRLEVPFSRHN
jgi:hypothetical protein